jgi:hypothetical protein
MRAPSAIEVDAQPIARAFCGEAVTHSMREATGEAVSSDASCIVFQTLHNARAFERKSEVGLRHQGMCMLKHVGAGRHPSP